MDLQMWAAVLVDFLFPPREPLARCKFFSEMNLQLINFIEDTLTNLADFFPLVGGPPRFLESP